MIKLEKNIHEWKKKLLDIGKRNKLINYKELKRSNINIIEPNISTLYTDLVVNEKSLPFPDPSDEIFLDEDDDKKIRTFNTGKIWSDRTLSEELKTLRSLRDKARSYIMEQGINVLYLAFGFLKWKEADHSELTITSPLVLVPVTLTVESITDPYELKLHEDEIILNPSLEYKLKEEFGITLPVFDNDTEDIINYLRLIENVIGVNSWEVTYDTCISLFTFMKMNMYNDIESNIEKIKNHPILKAFAGDPTEIKVISEIYDQYDHDKNIRPIDTFQVVDTDSSQQDAVLYSKKNLSFILQGPPGTGKSQTITNIISEALSDGKKILFVSEKAAALEVVYNRLTNVGLKDFCISLHNHKKNKKEVLNDLNKTLNLDKKALRDEVIFDLHNLETERDHLNQYVRDLHIKNKPLNKSIFEITGLLAALPNVKDLLFSIENVVNIDQDYLNSAIKALDDFSHTLGMMKKDYKENPWVGCSIDRVSHEFRLNAEIELKCFNETLILFNHSIHEFNQKMGVKWSLILDNIEDYINFLIFAANPPCSIPIQWLKNNLISLDETLVMTNTYKQSIQKYHSIYKELRSKYKQEYFNLNGKELYEGLIEGVNKLKNIINKDSNSIEKILDDKDNILLFLDKEQQYIYNVNQVVKYVCEEYRLKHINTYDDLLFVSSVLTMMDKQLNPTEMWFEADQQLIVDKLLEESIGNQIEIEKIHTEINKYFDKAIYTIDSRDILCRFRTKYTNFFRKFMKQYKTDRTLILSNYKGSELLTDQLIVKYLQLINDLNNHKDWFCEKEKILVRTFGSRYLNEYTNWDVIQEARTNFNNLKKIIGNEVYNTSIKKTLIDGCFSEKIKDAYDDIKSYISNDQWNKIKSIIDIELVDKLGFRNITTSLRSFSKILTETSSMFCNIKQYCNENVKLQSIFKDLQNKLKLEEIEKRLNDNNKVLNYTYGALYDGLSTDWNTILQALEWSKLFNEYKKGFDLSNTFIQNFQSSSSCEKLADILFEHKELILQRWNWFKSLFDVEREMSNENTNSLSAIVNKCIEGFSLLEEWVDYRNHRKTCEDIGLEEFIRKAEEENLLKSELRNGYLHRFYKLLLDVYISKYPSVYNFRQKKQLERIDNFKDLDRRSLEIARARIKSKLIESLPNINFTTSADDELSILQREINKQRRIMPLRKLFASIPNLLLTLKPCMMMSPLSVSKFLKSESYDFDMVIFDEASQVKVEDAVGAIMRGKSVVICGDNKQLPPTNFFGSSAVLDDYDSEEDELDLYESILDNALTVLPHRTLKWHYRSRHEHLIAFSNVKIYNNDLVTFPSCKDDIPDEGVEFIYVPDGIYDRGASRINRIEAKKVAELVIKHFVSYPTRSLGVVTFSSSQQTAIEDELRYIRYNDNSYENFFSEENEEPFFVKNIETVQGDERDTIIFSIGYAKDGTGKPMAMNLGPLSKNGGERRLNVAITRAKHNVKLVGSIHHTDIDLERTSAKGVHLLRSYIEFAKYGPAIFEKEISSNSKNEFDSPFERSVYDFLVSKGYKVETQVGCSGYKIDLGVKHPEIPGVFIMGIECDGATYHSTRTARERDRIRQTVLEDMGWFIYRIWSTDYIKDKKTENKKLEEVINNRIKNFKLENSSVIIESESNNIPNHDDMLESVNYMNDYDNEDIVKYGFKFYEMADIRDVIIPSEDIYKVIDIVKEVVNTESPIHFDLLCRRLAPLLDREKVTNSLKNLILTAISKCIYIEKRGDFIWNKNENIPTVRIPKDPQNHIREISHIACEEIEEAMMMIIMVSFGITKDGLFSEVKRIFGYNRTGQKISMKLELVFQNILEANSIKLIDNKISV